MKMPPQAIDNQTEGNPATLPFARNARQAPALRHEERRLDFIVRESYDEIYEFDLTLGLCHILHDNSIDPSTLPRTRPLAEMVAEAETGRIYPEDLPIFRSIFDAAILRARFAGGEQEIIAEYRRKKTAGYEWYSICLKPIPYPGEDETSLSVVLLLKNINSRKRAEEAARRLQTKYFLALRDSCGHICDVNLSTGQYVLSITGDDLLARLPTQGDFDEGASMIAKNLIHPDDREVWTAHMTLDKLQKAFAHGRRQFSFHYRFGSALQGWQWRCNTAVYLPGETVEERSVLIFARDISEQKKAEQLASSNRLLRLEVEQQKRNAARDARYRIIVEQTGAGIFEWIHSEDALPVTASDSHRDILAAGHFYNSPKVTRDFCLPSEGCDFLGMLSARGDIHPEDRPAFEAFRVSDDYSSHREALCRVLLGDVYLWYRFTLAMLVEDGRVERMTGTVQDADAQTRASQALELSNIRYRTVLQQTDTIEFEFDVTKGQGYISPVLWERYDAEPWDASLRREFIDYLHVYPGDAARVKRVMEQFRLTRPNQAELQCRVRDKTGNFVWCRILTDCIRDENGKLLHMLGTLHNIDRETRAYEALKAKAERDTLTGIWNQETFLCAVERMLEEKPQKHMALLMLDIDKFKVVNEIFGLEGGNRALVLVGRVIRKFLGAKGMYARMYADVFCMVTPYDSDDDLIKLMTKIIAALSTKEYDYMLSPCFGVCRIPPDASSAITMVEMAGYAHKAVKAAAGRQWAFYDETMRSRVIEQKQIESEMEQALQLGQFQIYLQPKYRLPGRTVEGAEALVRWLHPQKGLIPPGKFIPLFEENGFITQLDAYVWEEVCKLQRRWIDEGKTPLPVSVNVSRMHMHNQDLGGLLTRLTDKYRLPKGLLELELTESMFPDNMKAMFQMLKELREAGFVLAMDDFGSGYSSLNMLKDMPLNVLKIDCEFFSETDETARSRTVVRHTVAMAHELEMRVVAEGVETESEASFLADTGCDTAQGFYFARPVPVGEFETLAFH